MANLKIETMPIGDLTPYHRNPRRGNMAAIAESLKARGQYKPIVVNKGTKTGIANETHMAGGQKPRLDDHRSRHRRP